MSVVASFRTRDGHWRLYVYHDRTADLLHHRRVVANRVRFDDIGRYLATMGVDPDDLVPE